MRTAKNYVNATKAGCYRFYILPPDCIDKSSTCRPFLNAQIIVVKAYGYNLAVLSSVMLYTTNGLIIKTDRYIEMARQWRHMNIQKRPAKAVDPIKLIITYRKA